ncbi:Spermidine/putrescine transport system permease protein PotB [bacterium HR36]|nr:Spermidine/putrescine transport system permease protein PotB [bacterium HR36]
MRGILRPMVSRWPEWMLLGFFGAFLLFPVAYVVPMAFRDRQGWTSEYLTAILTHPLLARATLHSLALGLVAVAGTTVLTLPLAWCLARYRIWAAGGLVGLLLIPLVLPPFVGALGLEQFFHPFGALNIMLAHLGLVRENKPIDWLAASGLAGVALMQTLHLYPILLLNLTAAFSNIDRSLEEAALSLGAGPWRVFWTVTMRLALPGYFAGAILVFISAFTDLGTPLMFNYACVLPVQIFNLISEREVNPLGYALVVVVAVISAGLFYLSRRQILRREYQILSHGAQASAEKRPPWWVHSLIWTYALALLGISLIPHFMVVLLALEGRWQFSVLPTAYSLETFRTLSHEGIVAIAVQNSLVYSLCSTLLDLVLGLGIAWVVLRRPSRLSGLLDGLAMLPLVLPGLVLAFGYLTCYTRLPLGALRPWLDPGQNPSLLLVLGYAVRRLPYVVRSAMAGLQQVPPVLEEVAASLGAGSWEIWRTIVLPLLRPHLLAGGILAFAFAMLEVSDSLLLAQQEKYYPITRAIYGLSLRPDDGPQLASALGVIGMLLLFTALVIASQALGRSLAQLFRA